MFDLIFVVGHVVHSLGLGSELETDERLLAGVRRLAGRWCRTFLPALHLPVGDEIVFVHRRHVAEPQRQLTGVERRLAFAGPVADRGEDENAVEVKFIGVETEENRPAATVEEHRHRHVQQIGQT